MPAALTDGISKYSNGSQPLPTQLASQRTAGSSTASINAATGWDTTTVKFVRMYQTTVSGGQTVPDQSTLSYFKCTLSGTTLSDLTLIWSATGSDQTYPAGATVDLSVSAGYTDALASNILTHADQDGTLKADAVDVTAVIKDDIITNAKMVAAIKPETNFGETTFDHVASGCVWSGDAYGSTRVASMTAGVVYIGGRRVVVAAVTSRTFTASKDVYVDVDNTGTLTYTDTTTNAASPALAANSIRLGIIVVGATNIAAATSVNQGQESRVLPIASSIPYAVTDSLGNLICPRDPNRRVLGYRQTVANQGSITAEALITGLTVPFIVPTGAAGGRHIKVTIFGHQSNTGGSTQTIRLRETNISGTVLQTKSSFIAAATASEDASMIYYGFKNAGSLTYVVSCQSASGTTTWIAAATGPSLILVELV